MSAIVRGKKEANEMRKISLSNNNVCWRIFEISEDQHEQLILRIKESRKFAIQLDELTDITKMAHLLAYVRYVYQRWSPRGRPWPRRHIFKSLALASKPQVLGLDLGLEALGPRKLPCPRLEDSTIF